MAILPDGAIQEVNPGDLDEFMVVRVCDEFVVDLMKAAGGMDTRKPAHTFPGTQPKALKFRWPSPGFFCE